MNKLRYFIFILAGITGLLLAAYGLARAGVLTPPQVLALQPDPGSHTADVDDSVSITYDQNMDPATVDPQSFAVHARETGWLTETLSVVSGTIMLDPLSPFHAGELVQVSATTATLSLGGEAPLTSKVWQFNTATWGGNAVFHESQTFDMTYSRDVALGDLDGDGDLDAIVVSVWGFTRVYINDGSGIFTLVQSIDHNTYEFLDAELGDLDGDGDLDAVLVDYANPGSNIILLNDGAGHFTQSSKTIPSQKDTYGKLGDLDGDGDLDLIVASGGFGAGTLRVWKNDGAGNFSLAQDFDSAYEHTDVALGDLDGDGDLDAFTTGWNNSYNKVWLNDGTGYFTQTQAIPNANVYGMQLGDLDGDGDLDAYLAGTAFDATDLPDEVWLNDGTGHFSDSGQRLDAVFTGRPGLGDLDADGDLDVFLPGGFYVALPGEVWANDGAGTFTLLRTLDENYYGAFATLGDLDNDGNLDAIVVGSDVTNDSLQVYLNGDWTRAAPIPHQTAGAAAIHCPDDPNGFYLLGGSDESLSYLDDFRYYDVISDTWTDLEPLPDTLFGIAAVCYQGKIYAAGGWDNNAHNSLFIYDIAIGNWFPGPNLPRIVSGAALGAWDGKLYLVGGSPSAVPCPPVPNVDIYDIASQTWDAQAGSPMPHPAAYSGWGQVGPFLFMAGGMTGNYNNNSTATLRYDLASDKWQEGRAFTSARAMLGFAITEQYLYAIGGDANGGDVMDAVDLVERMELSQWPLGVWEMLNDPLPAPRVANSVGLCSETLTGGEIWSMGGATGSVGGYYGLDHNLYYPAGACPGNTFAFDLDPDSRVGEGNPGELVIYTLVVTNTGDIPDAYHVTILSGWAATASATNSLWPGKSVALLITVAVPAGAPAGEVNTAVVTVTSQGDAEQVDEATLTTTARAVYGVDLATDIPAQSGFPGKVITYTLHLTNTGNITDTINLNASGNLWGVTIPITRVVLAAGGSMDVTVDITVAENARAGDEDTVTITATSQGDPAQIDEATLTTTALPVYGVALAADNPALSGFPDRVITYTLRLTNTGNITDTIDLSASGNLWEVTLPITRVVLTAGESVGVIVYVSVAGNAFPGEQDVVTITATSQGNPSQTAQVELTTTAAYVRIYLPVIHK